MAKKLISDKPTYEELKKRVLELERAELEYKLANEALRKNEIQNRLLADNVSDLIWTMDMAQRFTYFSPAILKFRGYTPDESLQIPIENALTPESYKKAVSAIMEGIASEGKIGVVPDRSRTLELEHIRKDGSTIWGEVTTSFIRNEEGLPSGIIGITRDITERKQAEAMLLENEQFMSSVFEGIQDGISVLNTDLSIRHVNGIMEKRYSEHLPLEGKKCFECYRNVDQPCTPCPSLRCLESGKTEMDIVPGPSGSNSEWIELYSYPIKRDGTEKNHWNRRVCKRHHQT